MTTASELYLQLCMCKYGYYIRTIVSNVVNAVLPTSLYPKRVERDNHNDGFVTLMTSFAFNVLQNVYVHTNEMDWGRFFV